jgi:hypothetical protein
MKGLTDRNFAPRMASIAEAMAAFVLTDQMILAGHINPVKIGSCNVPYFLGGLRGSLIGPRAIHTADCRAFPVAVEALIEVVEIAKASAIFVVVFIPRSESKMA